MPVHLEPVTAATVREVCDLRVNPSQEPFVASNAVSLAEAQFHPEAWCRAVYDEALLVGFVMLHEPAHEPTESSPGWMIWRLMIDARFQGRGLGSQVVQELLTMCAPGPAARCCAWELARATADPRRSTSRWGSCRPVR